MKWLVPLTLIASVYTLYALLALIFEFEYWAIKKLIKWAW